MIAGPCAAESEEQTLRIAQRLSNVSGVPLIYRAGAWKPRTSPETFQGVGEVALQWLHSVKLNYGVPVATEVSTPEQVRKALETGIDYLWLGARTSANPILVQALADVIAQSPSRPKGILIKNPVNNDAALWIGNIRRFQKSDFSFQILAVHRGCGHKPCWEMAYRLRQELPQVPLLLDPSHMSGQASRVAELCCIAEELEYDGLMIEVHDEPQHALSDAPQQIPPDELELIIGKRVLKPDTPLELRWLRRIMDEVDDVLWETIAQRMAVSQQIGTFKKANNMDIVQPTRFEEIVQRRLKWASAHGIAPDTVTQIINALHTESIRKQQ